MAASVNAEYRGRPQVVAASVNAEYRGRPQVVAASVNAKYRGRPEVVTVSLKYRGCPQVIRLIHSFVHSFIHSFILALFYYSYSGIKLCEQPLNLKQKQLDIIIIRHTRMTL